MDIAIITGASSGLGLEYVKCIDKMHPHLEEIWLIARRQDRLEEIAKTTKIKCRILALDITKDEDIEVFSKTLKEIQPNVKILINNAGFGKLGYFDEIECSLNAGMIKLNCEALTVITSKTLAYIKSGGEIINISSIASFVPNARMAVYCSTKAFVTSFSRALRYELKRKKINVLAVCPGPMQTEFLPVANIAPGKSNVFDVLPFVKADVVAKKSLKASKKCRAIYTNLAFYKFYRFLSKIIPHKILMKLAAA